MHQARKKWGGYGKKVLLALAAASAIFCGGLVNVGATVHVNEGTGATSEVYTTVETYNKTEVDNALTAKGAATDVATNKADIANLKTAVGDAGSGLTKAVADQKADIATNRANINNLDGKLTNLTTTVNGKADQTAVTALDGRVGSLETTVGDASSGLVKDVADLKNQGNDLNTAIGNKADQSGLDAANAKITDLQKKTTNLSADGKTLTGMTAVGGATVSANKVNAGELKVTGQISNGTVNTTLADINDSMTQTKTNKEDIANLKTTTGDQDTAIKDLQKKTTNISYADGAGTSIDGITVKDGNIVGNGNSAITGLANVETNTIKTGSINGKSLTGTTVATATDVAAETLARKEADNKLEEKINEEKTAREGKDNELEGKITKNTQDIAKLDENGVKYDTAVKDTITLKGPDSTKITNLKDADLSDSSTDAVTGKQLNKTNEGLKKEAQTREDMDTLLSKRADALEKNTGGITRNDAKDETYIEKNVTVDNQGNITAKGTVTANGGVDAGAVNAGSLTVTDASHLKGNVTMDNTLTVKGDTSLNKTDVGGALNVTGESRLKNTTVGGTLTAEKDATFEKNVTVEKDLTVNGKLNVDKISMKNDELKNGKKHDSATTITADEISNLAKVTEQGNTTESQFTHNEKGTFNYAKDEKSTGEWKRATSNVTADGVSNKMTDFDENRHTYSQTATESKEQLVNGDKSKSNFEKKTAEGNTISITEKDADGNPKSSLTNTQTVAGEKTSVTNKDSSSTINQGADQIRYNVTSKDENKTSSSIEVKADGITNTSKDGTITNDAKDIENNATGDITNTAQNGSIINKAENGNISNTAQNVTNEGTESVTNKVGKNEVKVSKDGVDIKAEDGKKITESVGTASRVVENDKITDKAADSTVTTEKGKGTTFGKEGSTGTTNIYGDSIKTGKINAEDTTTDKLTAGAAAGVDGGRLTVDAKDGVKGSYKFGDYTSRSYILANTLTSGVDNGKEPIDADFVGSRTDHYMDGDKAKLDETVKDADGSNVTKKTSTDTATTITDGITTTKTEQGTKDITNTATAGTITNDAKVITNKASEVINNEAININNTATGTITSKASEIKNEADKLISNKVGENTWENMEDGKITTSIKNGTKQNLTQSDAEKTEHSVVNGSNSTVNKQTSEEITDAVTNGTTTNVTQNTATSSNNTIADKNGNANTVISTVDGTSFINSKAAAPVTGASGAGTEVKTTIKGNTITTGKVTMDYAQVMRDLGVNGNANITGKTTTGSLEVTGTSTLKGDVTMESNATVKKNLTVNGITTTKTLKVTENAEIDGNATIKGDVTASSYKVGDKTYISAAGINANGQKITNVADGSISEGSKDAVNGGQLYNVKNDLEGKVNKVGANAAAMANLHPMEFDPDSKWNIAAAIGNYGSETAAALGAFYRPNDDVMVNLSTAFGTGENMVGGGVSVRLGKGGNKLSREENNALKAQVDDLTARMDALLSVLNPNMSKDFPDVPENHWAYEAVSRLAGNDIVQGYPDGEFHGERTMTRYEMAEIIYNALSRGAEAEKELVEEFKPELQAMAASEKATAEKAEG